MRITLNGQEQLVADSASIAELVVHLTGEQEPKGIAVALNRCVVPRSEWESTAVSSGSVLEIVTAAAGG